MNGGKVEKKKWKKEVENLRFLKKSYVEICYFINFIRYNFKNSLCGGIMIFKNDLDLWNIVFYVGMSYNVYVSYN